MKIRNIFNVISLLCIIYTNIGKCSILDYPNYSRRSLIRNRSTIIRNKSFITNNHEFVPNTERKTIKRNIKCVHFIKPLDTIKDNTNKLSQTDRNAQLQQLILFLNEKTNMLNESINNFNSDFGVIKNDKNSEKSPKQATKNDKHHEKAHKQATKDYKNSETDFKINMKYNPLLLYGTRNTSYEPMNSLNSDFNVNKSDKNSEKSPKQSTKDYKNSEKPSETDFKINMKYNPILLLYGTQNTSLDPVHIEGIKTIYKIIKCMKEIIPVRRVKKLQKLENICNCFLQKEQNGKINFADVDISISDLVKFKIEVSNMYNCGCISMPYHDGIQNICNKLIDYIEENRIIKCSIDSFNNIRNFYCELCNKTTKVDDHIQLTIKKFNDIRNQIESASNKIKQEEYKQEEYMKELTEQLLDFLILVKTEIYSNWGQKKESIKCKKDLVTLINKSISAATPNTKADFVYHCISMIHNSSNQIINQECGKQEEQIDKLVDSILLQYFNTQLQNIFKFCDSYEFYYSYMMEDAGNKYTSQKSM